MKRVYLAPTLFDAQLAADLLSQVGIANRIFNANAAGALGEVPFLDAQPEIWIEDESQLARAQSLLTAAGEAAGESGEKVCPHCGEPNPGHFLSCWRCNAALPA